MCLSAAVGGGFWTTDYGSQTCDALHQASKYLESLVALASVRVVVGVSLQLDQHLRPGPRQKARQRRQKNNGNL